MLTEQKAKTLSWKSRKGQCAYFSATKTGDGPGEKVVTNEGETMSKLFCSSLWTGKRYRGKGYREGGKRNPIRKKREIGRIK